MDRSRNERKQTERKSRREDEISIELQEERERFCEEMRETEK
jgi:hypothetical protein